MKPYRVLRKQPVLRQPAVLRRAALRDQLGESLDAVRVIRRRFSKRPGLGFYLRSGYRLDLRFEANNDLGWDNWWETDIEAAYLPQSFFLFSVSPEHSNSANMPDTAIGDTVLDARYRFQTRQAEKLKQLFADPHLRERLHAEDRLLLRATRENRLLALDNLPRRHGALRLRLRRELTASEDIQSSMGLVLRALQVMQQARWIRPPFDAEGHRQR